jgi:hypothetical protein
MELSKEEIEKFRIFMKEHVTVSFYDVTTCREGADYNPEMCVSLLVDGEEISSCSEYLST